MVPNTNVMMTDSGYRSDITKQFQECRDSTSISYSDGITMKEDQYIDEVIEKARELSKKAKNLYDDILSNEKSIVGYDWYNYALEYDDSIKKSFFTSTQLNEGSLIDILNDEGKEDGGLQEFDLVCNFSRLAGAIDELRQAIKNYSSGVNVSAARTVLSYFTSGEISEEPAPNYPYPTLTSPSLDASNLEVPEIDVDKNNELDGADNIPMEDSVTDDITKVSAKDLLVDAVKNSNGIVSAGATSVLGNAFSKGIGSSNKIVSKLEAEKIDDIIEPEEPIPNLDEDEDNLFDDVVSTVTSIVTPDVPTTTINGKNVEGKSGSSIAIPAIAGVGVASAGVVGGKVYMDKKNNGDDSEDDDDNKFDDFEFENSEEKQEETVNNNDSKENVVDFKNKIMDDNL